MENQAREESKTSARSGGSWVRNYEDSSENDDEGKRGTESTFNRLSFVGETMSSVVMGPQARHGHSHHGPTSVYDPTWDVARIGLAILTESMPYKLAMAGSILFNMVLLILETDLRAHLRTEWWEVHRSSVGFTFSPPEWMQNASKFLLIFYVIDLVFRMYVARMAFFKATANKFDFGIVSTDCLVLLLEPLQDLPSVAVLRVLRMLRIVRVLRSFLVFRELYLMMQGLVSAIRSIIFATFLIAVVLTLWSIMAVEFVHMANVELADENAYGDCPEIFCRNAFASVWLSSLTFLKGIIAGDSWGQLAYPLIILRPTSAFVLLGSLLMVQLGLLNLIVAVIVDRAQAARENDEELMYTEKQETLEASYKRLKALFNRMDADGGGTLSLVELQESYQEHAAFREILDLMDIRERDLELVFNILDMNKDDEVSYTEFVEKLHEMKTFNSHTLLIYIKHFAETIFSMMGDLRKDVDARDNMLRSALAVAMPELSALLLEEKTGAKSGGSQGTGASPTYSRTGTESQLSQQGKVLAALPSPPTMPGMSTMPAAVMAAQRASSRSSFAQVPAVKEKWPVPEQPKVENEGLDLTAPTTVVAPDGVNIASVQPQSFEEAVKVSSLPAGSFIETDQVKSNLERALMSHGEAMASSVQLNLERALQVAVRSFIEAAIDCTNTLGMGALASGGGPTMGMNVTLGALQPQVATQRCLRSMESPREIVRKSGDAKVKGVVGQMTIAAPPPIGLPRSTFSKNGSNPDFPAAAVGAASPIQVNGELIGWPGWQWKPCSEKPCESNWRSMSEPPPVPLTDPPPPAPGGDALAGLEDKKKDVATASLSGCSPEDVHQMENGTTGYPSHEWQRPAAGKSSALPAAEPDSARTAGTSSGGGNSARAAPVPPPGNNSPSFFGLASAGWTGAGAEPAGHRGPMCPNGASTARVYEAAKDDDVSIPPPTHQ